MSCPIKRSIVATISLVLFLLSSCKSRDSEFDMRVDYEDVHGVVLPEPEWLTDSVAHSGRWASQLLPNSHYGPSTILNCWDLGNPKRIRTGGWVWLPHNKVHVALVVQIDRNGQTVYYQANPLHEVVKRYRMWQLVHQIHSLPADLLPTDQVKIYLWQWGDHYKIYFDDLFVENLR